MYGACNQAPASAHRYWGLAFLNLVSKGSPYPFSFVRLE
jgi:hypothetical protein